MSILFKHKINWAYAFGEVLLIFVGITLAIAFNNWNEERKERELGKEFIRQFYINLHQDISKMESVVDLLERQFSSAEDLLAYYESSEKMIDDSLKVFQDVLTASYSVITDRNENEYDQLKREGKLGILRNEQLVNDFAEFYAFYDTRIMNFKQSPEKARAQWRESNVRYFNLTDARKATRYGYDKAPSRNYFLKMAEDAEAPGVLLQIYISSHWNLIWFSDLKKQAQSIITYMEITYPELNKLSQ